jgi:hypothetical protein
VKVVSNVQRQIDLTDLELVNLKIELGRLFAEFLGEDQERYPTLKTLFELLTEEEKP